MNSCHRRECTAWTPPEGQARWADGCDHVFLDIGANRGVSIRKLFEPEAYPTAGYDWDNAGLPRWLLGKNRTAPNGHIFYAPLFDAHFGTDRTSNNFGGICAFGFEPNPQHTPRLQALERCYTQRGWRVKIFTETAVSDIDGNTTLRLGPQQDAQHNWGASISDRVFASLRTRSFSVATVDLAAWLAEHVTRRRTSSAAPLARTREVHAAAARTHARADADSDIREAVTKRRGAVAWRRDHGDHGDHASPGADSGRLSEPLPPWVFAKMDIEGAEFRTLGHMLMSGVLCAETIGTMTIEYHPHVWKQSMRADEKNWFVDLFMRSLPTVLHFNPRYCTPPKLITKQDDSWSHDTFMPTVCGRSLPDEQPIAAKKEYPRHFAMFAKQQHDRHRR